MQPRDLSSGECISVAVVPQYTEYVDVRNNEKFGHALWLFIHVVFM